MTKLVRSIKHVVEDAYKSHESKRERNHSQDDIDAEDLDKLLAEIQIVNGYREAHVFDKNGLKKTEDGFNGTKKFEDDIKHKDVKSFLTSESSTAVSFGNKVIIPLITEREPDKVIIPLITEREPDKVIIPLITEREPDSKCKKSNSDGGEIALLDKLHENDYIKNNEVPFHERKSKMSLTELVNVPSIESCKSVSFSDSVNEDAKMATSFENVPNSSIVKGAALSLADLAKQHKSQRAKLDSSKDSMPVIFHKVNNVTSLPALVEHCSAQKKDISVNVNNPSNSYFNGSKYKNYAESTSMIVGSSSSTTSMAALSKAHSQLGGNIPSVSLLQLAQQHKHSTSILPTMLPHSDHTNGTTTSLVSRLGNVTIEDNKSRQYHNSSIVTDAFLSSKLSATESVPNLSLALNLKMKQLPDPGNRKILSAQQKKEDTKETVNYIPSQVDVMQKIPHLYLEERTSSDLFSQPSTLGFVLCCLKRKRKLINAPLDLNRSLKYPKFMCNAQVGDREMYKESILQDIKPFNFSTPSPDDIVKSRQQQAFTRPDKEFEF